MLRLKAFAFCCSNVLLFIFRLKHIERNLSGAHYFEGLLADSEKVALLLLHIRNPSLLVMSPGTRRASHRSNCEHVSGFLDTFETTPTLGTFHSAL